MRKIYLGYNIDGKRIELDLDEEKNHFILLAGATGSGKSIFHNNLYKELTDKYQPSEIGFVFFDLTKVDFYEWNSDYLITPTLTNSTKAIEALHELAELKINKKVFVHIEECDMVYLNKESVESALEKIKNKDNFYVIYSTSRLDPSYLADWLEKFIDLKVVFNVARPEDSIFLLGNDSAYFYKNLNHNPGERILAFSNQQILCKPFSDSEVKVLTKFKI